MNLKGKAIPLTQQGFDSATRLLESGAAELWALLTVETQGCGYLFDRRPVILFERHVFHHQTGGAHDESNPSISNPVPGGYQGGAAEYGRLEEAMGLNEHAALNSASWGIGQIMGMNSGIAGFPSVEAMVAAMTDEEDAQLAAIAQCLIRRRLHTALARHEWEALAKGYNSPNYQENRYDSRLATAYASFSSGALPQIPVRQAQVLLTFLGFHPGAIDGIPGKQTTNAIARFRREQGRDPHPTISAPLLAALQFSASQLS